MYKVYLSAEGEYRNETWDLGQFFVRNSQGAMVPLSTLVTMKPTSGPDFTNRFNLFRTSEINGTPAPGYSSQQALEALKEVAAQTIPAGWSYDWANMSYQEVKAAGSGGVVFVFALVLVFLILAAQYESWSLPLSVLLGVPFAVFGAMAGLYLSRFFSDSYINNVFAQIGFVTLIGLSAKNAILIVEFAKMEKEKGSSAIDAALSAAKLRLRPILMTSFAFILGVVPLVRAAGAGAESRKVMGMAVFSGLLVATTLAIYLVPMLFVMVEKYFVREKHAAAKPPSGGQDFRNNRRRTRVKTYAPSASGSGRSGRLFCRAGFPETRIRRPSGMADPRHRSHAGFHGHGRRRHGMVGNVRRYRADIADPHRAAGEQ